MPPRRMENRACRPGGPNLPRPQRTENRERPCGATGGALGGCGMFWGEHEGHEGPRRDTKDAPEKLGSLEVWRLGRATEGEARATAFGGDEAEHCAAITRDTKDCQNGKRRLFRRFARKTLRYLTDFCRFGACWRTQDGGFAVSYNAFSVARLPRALFTVLCSLGRVSALLFSRARQRPFCHLGENVVK